jgi:hypothetical protein
LHAAELQGGTNFLSVINASINAIGAIDCQPPLTPSGIPL